MSQQDFRINASVMTVLTRRWVDTARLDVGTTNGVVYIRGAVPPQAPNAPATTAGSALLGDIEREIRSLPGVRDVVFGVNGWRKSGGRWVWTPSTS